MRFPCFFLALIFTGPFLERICKGTRADLCNANFIVYTTKVAPYTRTFDLVEIKVEVFPTFFDSYCILCLSFLTSAWHKTVAPSEFFFFRSFSSFCCAMAMEKIGEEQLDQAWSDDGDFS